MSQWTAEVQVEEPLARRLVSKQFPPLPEHSLRQLSEGWDYTVFLVDDAVVFRFPRREIVVQGTAREISLLPLLRLPVAIPRPVHIGQPGDDFPWPFYGAPYLPGEEPIGLVDEVRRRLARPLARFLRALHASELLELPVDPQRRSDMSVRVPRTRQALAAIADLWEPPPLVDELLAVAETLPPAEPGAVVHGDLHFRQLLQVEGDLTGVIDWVDICRADVGQDLQLLWSFLPPSARDEFLDEYGAVAEHSLLRARVLALNLNAILARYGHDNRADAVEAEAISALERTVV